MAISSSPRSLPGRRPHNGDHAKQQSGMFARALAAPMADYYMVLLPVLFLIGFGMMMVLSSSSVFAYVWHGDSYYFVKRQMIFLMGGFPLAFWLSRMSMGLLSKLSWLTYIVAAVLLMLTFVPGIGIEIAGNRNWIKLFGDFIRIQPSEFAKLSMIVWGASVLANKRKLLDQPLHLIFPFLPMSALLIGLVLVENDLGTAMVMSAILLAILFFAGTPYRVLLPIVGFAIAMVGLMVGASHNRGGRIAAFLDPSKASEDSIRQARQSLYGLASGGWWGRGIGNSREAYGGLSEAHTDFVFSIIGEELGFIGAIFVIAFFALLIFAGIRIAKKATTDFAKYCAMGVTSWFFIQASVNIAVVLGVLPVLGVPLPFISYGGSALMAAMLAAGVLLACARNEPKAQRAIAKRKAKKSAPSITAIVDNGRS